jgi:hypothetical protein
MTDFVYKYKDNDYSIRVLSSALDLTDNEDKKNDLIKAIKKLRCDSIGYLVQRGDKGKTRVVYHDADD